MKTITAINGIRQYTDPELNHCCLVHNDTIVLFNGSTKFISTPAQLKVFDTKEESDLFIVDNNLTEPDEI